jgi:apolipoprotein N-acyltransferase
LIQDVSVVCNGVQLCPGPDVRVAPALSFGGALLVPLGVILLRTRKRIPDPDLPVMWVVFAALVLLAAIGLLWALFSGGFGVSGWVVELVPRVLVIAGLVELIWHLLRRRKRMRSLNPWGYLRQGVGQLREHHALNT